MLRWLYTCWSNLCIAWGVLKKWLPKQLNLKKRFKGHSVVNPHLKESVFQWLWRSNKIWMANSHLHRCVKKWNGKDLQMEIKLTLPPTGHPSRRNHSSDWISLLGQEKSGWIVATAMAGGLCVLGDFRDFYNGVGWGGVGGMLTFLRPRPWCYMFDNMLK